MATKPTTKAQAEEKKEPSKREMFDWLEQRTESKKQELTLGHPLSSATNHDEILEELHKLKEIKSLFTVYIVNRIARALFFSILVLAAIIPLLFWLRLKTTSVELDLVTSAVRFTTTKGQGLQPVIENLGFESVGFSELSTVEIASQRPIDMTPFSLSVLPVKESYVTLEGMIVPEESSVYLASSSGAEAGSYEAAVTVCESLLPKEDSKVVATQTCDTDLTLELEVSEKERLDVSQAIEEQLREGSLVVQAAPYRDVAKLLHFYFTPLDQREDLEETLRVSLSEQLQISSLSFMRLDELSDSQRARGGAVSGIESGTLFYQDLNTDIEMRPGEYLTFNDARGSLRTVVLEDNFIRLQFRGTVRGMKTGLDARATSLMPTYLEWLRSKDGFRALVAGVVTLFVGLVPLGMWWLDRRLGKV